MDIKRLVRHALSFIPTKVPTGITEFHAWAEDIIDLAGAPKNDSVKFSIAAMVPHSNSQDAYKPKRYYVLTLMKAMANQVAYAIVQELKTKQAEAEAARIAAEAAKSEVSDEQKA